MKDDAGVMHVAYLHLAFWAFFVDILGAGEVELSNQTLLMRLALVSD